MKGTVSERQTMSEHLGLHEQRAREERFLVTGSEGCIGAWTVRNLVTAGCYTVATDLPPAGRRLGKVLDPGLLDRVVHVDGDVTAEGMLERVIREHEITRVIHLAALQVPFVAADPILGGEVNVIGTLRVLESVRAAGRQVRGVAYASSTGATGPIDAPHEPLTLYGAFKLCNEHTARLYARDYDTYAIGLRPCIVYGPGRDQGLTAALTHALKAVVLDVPYEIPFGGLVDAQYTQDVATAFIRCALLDGNEGAAVYDLHGDAITVADYIATIGRVVPRAEELVTYADVPIPGNVDVDDHDLVARLGALPKTSLEEGIRRSIEVFQRHRDAGTLTVGELPLAPA
jgi:UDP-glucuronate 4-epimerase